MARLTAQARKILREAGVVTDYGLWTNKYDTCRTVKCYAPADRTKLDEAANLIKALCEENVVPFDMEIIQHSSRWRAMTSVIFRFPRDY